MAVVAAQQAAPRGVEGEGVLAVEASSKAPGGATSASARRAAQPRIPHARAPSRAWIRVVEEGRVRQGGEGRGWMGRPSVPRWRPAAASMAARGGSQRPLAQLMSRGGVASKLIFLQF